MGKHRSLFGESVQRFLHSKTVIVSLCWLALMLLTALAAPFLAGNRPLYVSYQGRSAFPVFSGTDAFTFNDPVSGHEKTIRYDEFSLNQPVGATVIWPPVRYAPHQSDLDNAGYTGPFDRQTRSRKDGGGLTELKGSERHLLGTGRRGDDVLAGLIHGTRVSMSVGFFSMAIAGIIGIALGALAGYFGDNRLKLSRGRNMMTLAGILPAWFYGFQLNIFNLQQALKSSPASFAGELLYSLLIFALIVFLFNRAGKLLHVFSWFSKEIHVPVDAYISRAIEILISLPRLILIITMAAIARPSLLNLVLIIGLTSWTEIARFTRAEMLRIRDLEYIQSARSMGLREWHIIFRHALPNAVGPALIALSFGIAGAILTESALSFLGIGVPPETVTWGSLLSAGKENFNAWWLVVFPGLAIFFTVTAFNLAGEGLRDAFDPRLKS